MYRYAASRYPFHHGGTLFATSSLNGGRLLRPLGHDLSSEIEKQVKEKDRPQHSEPAKELVQSSGSVLSM